ncbi:glycosyltransferase [Blastopirellula marina]|uniref:Glycosyltransferase 2-like domain-containing protein n=1 Tax=Blastopirellula marina TaxID=124 RepID=A0A2S8GQV3_9BACT|nr:glycosyltransferase [Blastopirellula marina]PQO46797.1 hypothetical protein C5Y93_06490 [Blastopirellula marina]
MKPSISVLMPIYNAEAYLASAIESVRRQTFEAWELLCLDDGSTDGSQNVVQRFAHSDRRIRRIALEHQGIVAALNHGVQSAQGEFIARLDADDIALPNRFAMQLEFLKRRPDVDLVGGCYQTIDGNGDLGKIQTLPQGYADVAAALRKSNCIAHPAVMIRRLVLDRFAGPYREFFPLAEDYDLWLRMSKRCRLENLPDVVLQYRRDFANPRPARTARQAISTLAVLYAHAQECGEPGSEVSPSTPFDESGLISLGCPLERIHAAVRKALLSEARATAKAGFPDQAKLLIGEAKRYAPRVTQWRDCLDYAWKIAQVKMAA